MEDISWTSGKGKSPGKDREIQGRGGAKPKTKTGYEKVGESRLFLPLSKWTEQFWTRLTGMAATEARVYKSHLKTYHIKEINLLEVQTQNPRENVEFTMDPGGAKYILSVHGFKVNGNELFAQIGIDNAFQVHTSLYLFHNQIRMEYNTLAVGKFEIPIRHPEALINYLCGLTNRKFSMTFKLTELVLEEVGDFKSLWMSQDKGMWICSQSLNLIKNLQLKTEDSEEVIVKTAQSMGNLEEVLLSKKEATVKTSDLDAGKTVEEIHREHELKKEEKTPGARGPSLTSTRIDGPGGPEVEEDEEVQKKVLDALHRKRSPFHIPVDGVIRDMFKRIAEVGEKFGDQDKSDPKVLANILVTVEALSAFLTEKCETSAVELPEGEGDEASPRYIQAKSVEELALGLQKMMEGREKRMERRSRRMEDIRTDWLASGLQEDMGRLWASALADQSGAAANWGSSEQW